MTTTETDLIHALVEFLLARITEEEDAARQWQAAMDADEAEPHSHGIPSWVVNAGGVVVPTRVLADCKAKRQIVYYVLGDHEIAKRVDGLQPMAGGPAILEYLARLYSDHPNFDPQWGPDVA